MFNPTGGDPNPGKTERKNASSKVTTCGKGQRASTRRDIAIRPQTPISRPRKPSHPVEGKYPAARITRRKGREKISPAENTAMRFRADLLKDISSAG
jgi:hypothetical protein